MSGSMWSCSGRHWLRAAAAWSVFGLSVVVSLEARSEPSAAVSPQTVQIRPTQIELSSPKISSNVLIVLDITGLDMSGLDASAFGDGDDPATK